MLDSQSRGAGFRTSKWFQVWLSLHSFEVDEMSTRYSWGLKACVRFFLSNFYFFTMKSVKLWKVFFISSKKLFSFSRYSHFCIFRPSFQHFPGTNDKCKGDNLWCHELNFQKNFLHAMDVLGYLPKSRRDMGLAFDVHFLHDFSIKMFFI